MTNTWSSSIELDVKDALRAYLEAVTIAEPVLERLWQEAGITLTQLSVLRQLRQAPMTASRLGQATGLSPASITRLTDRLERRGLVSRHRPGGDRRAVEIRLDPAGERLLGEIRLLRGTDLHQAIQSMPWEERQALTSALADLVRRTRALAGEEAVCR